MSTFASQNKSKQNMKLNDIAEFVTDKICSGSISLENYVTTDSLLQNKRGREAAQNLPPMQCALTHYKRGDVLVANIRPYLKKVWFADSEGGCSSDVLVFRAKNGHYPSFLYTVLIQDAFFDYAMSGAKGSKMPRGDKDQIMRYELPTFSSVEEENIGNIMVDIMSKININRQINDNLEAMAKQLYDYWFVQFDFPNEEGKPYKSSGGAMVWNERLKREIPIDWTCCSIKEMCDINKKTINKDEHKQIEYLDTGSITQGHISNTEIYSVDMAPSRAQRKVEDLSILYSSVRPRLLHYGILSTPKENFIVSTGFVTLDAKCKKMALMVYYFLTSNTITEHLASIADTAVSSYPSISPDDIAYLDIVIPSNDIIQKYNDIVEPMFRKMSTLRKEIDSLTKQRDELLPLLMNGQASVNYHLSVLFLSPFILYRDQYNFMT